MARYAFYYDASRCTGCKTCQFACKDFHDLPAGISYRNVYEYVGGTTCRDNDGSVYTDCFGYFFSLSCCHCEDPVCTKVCPTEAMHVDGETGLVLVNKLHCIGCGYCHLACPYNAPKVDKQLGCSVKCDGCWDRVVRGMKPVCVEACPARALDFGVAEEMCKLGVQADVRPLPYVEVTHPRLYVKPCQDMVPSTSDEGSVVNLQEIY